MDSTAVLEVVGDVADTAVTKLYGWEGINAGHGIMVSSTGMFIVFTALVSIAILIALLPYLMKLVALVNPEPVAPVKKKSPVKSTNDDEAVAVAIALATHTAGKKGN